MRTMTAPRYPPSPGEEVQVPPRDAFLPTVKSVLGVFPAIAKEFADLMAASPLTFHDTPSDDPALTAGQ